MLLTILAFLASLVPSILIFVLLKRRHGKVKKEIENKANDTTAETMPLSGENEEQDTEHRMNFFYSHTINERNRERTQTLP